MSVFTPAGLQNQMRWNAKSSGFIEVWYVTLTHRRTGAAIWIRYTITAPLESPPYCELWGVVFAPEGKRTFAAKQRYAVDELSAGGAELVRIGDAWLSESHLEGRLQTGSRQMEWSLDFAPSDRCFNHLPPQLWDLAEKRVSVICSPNLSVPFSGWVELDGDTVAFDHDLGCQSHRWGRRHSDTWAWAHCSNFEGHKPAVFEGLAARSRLGRVPLPTLTFIYVSYAGEDIVFNTPLSSLRARSHYELPAWAFTASNERWKIAGAARSTLDRMMQVRYVDPDGSARHCVNSEIGDIAFELYRQHAGRWIYEASLSSLRSAHFELGRREAFQELEVTL